MKLNKQILEAILRGINLAIDDFDNMQDIETRKVGLIKNTFSTKESLELRKCFVDLGLPSGTLWAKYNIGVDPNKLNTPKDWYGGYYAWGEIEEKQVYNWKTYKYANGILDKLTKYCTKDDYLDKNSKLDNLTTLLAKDDIAVHTNKLPWEIKMPTKELFDELLEYTTSEWVKNYQGINNLNGRLFTSKRNGNKIFIPAAGFLTGLTAFSVNSDCYLWSLSLNLTTPSSAYILDCYSSDCYLSTGNRFGGFSVRAVLVQ